MFEYVPPTCVLYWNVTGDFPATVMLPGFNGLATAPIPIPHRIPADVLNESDAVAGEG